MSDDHEPITEEWWAEWFGAANIVEEFRLTQSIELRDGFTLRLDWLSTWPTLRKGNVVMCLPNVTTRGDVRELCRLVGWEKPHAALPTTKGVK